MMPSTPPATEPGTSEGRRPDWPIAEFGFLTLATPNDYLKAVALACSLRVSNPGVPIAVACSPRLRPLIDSVFDVVVDEDPTVRGFAHKVHLDRYSPFRTTMFFDSDVLVFRPVTEFIGEWPDVSYTACGIFGTDGVSAFGLDRAAMLERLGKNQLVIIDGAGHSLFRMPAARTVFDRAREITADYQRITSGATYADEDVLNIVMTELGLPPARPGTFFSRFLTGRPGTVAIDAAGAGCTLTDAESGQVVRPCMMHFAGNEAPFHYGWAMWRVLRHYRRPRSGLIGLVLHDAWERHVIGFLLKLGPVAELRRRRSRARIARRRSTQTVE